MPGYLVDDTRKVTTHRLKEMKEQGKKIAMLTSYDYTTAKIVDEAGVDIILVGDSASNVMAGNHTTLPITLDQMIYHARSVVRGVKRALVVCDMPFGTYQVNPVEGVRNAIRIMQASELLGVEVVLGMLALHGVGEVYEDDVLVPLPLKPLSPPALKPMFEYLFSVFATLLSGPVPAVNCPPFSAIVLSFVVFLLA